MSINYKNASVILANTNMTTVLTIPVTAVAIVKSVYISNNSTGAVTVNCDFRDSSATSDVEFFRKDIPATSTCLLYTSPSPRDGLLSRMPSSA